MAVKGDLVSVAAYTQSANPASPATPALTPDALLVTNTLTALTITTVDGNTITFAGTFPPSGTILPIAAASYTYAPAASITALYR